MDVELRGIQGAVWYCWKGSLLWVKKLPNMVSKVQLCPHCWDTLHLFVPVLVKNNIFFNLYHYL